MTLTPENISKILFTDKDNSAPPFQVVDNIFNAIQISMDDADEEAEEEIECPNSPDGEHNFSRDVGLFAIFGCLYCPETRA